MRFNIINVLKSAALAILVAVSGHAVAATTTSTTSLGGLVAGSTTIFGNSFDSAGTFSDYYTFSLGSSSGGAAGTLYDTDKVSFFLKDVTLTSLTLTGSSFAGTQSAAIDSYYDGIVGNITGFSFSGLGAGTYTLGVAGKVGDSWALLGGAYAGEIHAVAATSPVASPAPEPADFAMALMGLAGVGMMVRRRSAR